MLKFLTYQWNKLEAASGMFSNGSGVGAASTDNFAAVVLSCLIGAFIGMIGGIILSHLLRFFAMIFNRPLGGYSWVIVGTLVGALVCAFMALNGNKS